MTMYIILDDRIEFGRFFSILGGGGIVEKRFLGCHEENNKLS